MLNPYCWDLSKFLVGQVGHISAFLWNAQGFHSKKKYFATSSSLAEKEGLCIRQVGKTNLSLKSMIMSQRHALVGQVGHRTSQHFKGAQLFHSPKKIFCHQFLPH